MKILDQVISFYENRMPSIARYLSEVILVSMLWGYYAFGFFYRQFLSHETKLFLLGLLVIYAVIILPYNFLIKKNTTLFFRSQLVILVALRSLQSIWAVSRGKMTGKILQSENERFALLFFIVKVIFIPAMTKYLVEYSILLYQTVVSENFNWQSISSNYQWFFLLSMLVVVVDTLYFSFGYMVEHSRLNNKIKSVDTSILGWAVALACYIPINTVTFKLFPFYPREEFFFINEFCTSSLYVMILLFYFMYLAATISLGAKCSNLTNRGIVSKGIYKYLRHPAYAAKVTSWWLMCIPIMSPKVAIAMTGWTLIYVLRAYTEEQHLKKDPDYRVYIKRTKWQFIPFVI